MCVDVNECDLDSNICGDEEICENIQGGYICLCADGFIELDEDHCIDIDECENGLMCDDNEICLNTRGSFKCLCIEGYQREITDENGIHDDCIDVDECSDNIYDCKENENCFNTKADYQIDHSIIGRSLK